MQYVSKKELIEDFNNRHLEFAQYLGTLTRDEFTINRDLKWSAAQELDHILKSLEPLSEILLDKELLLNKFGKGNEVSLDYNSLTNRYKTKLSEGGKAFGRFLPEKVRWSDRTRLLDQLSLITGTITETLNHYSEEELDELRIPHPLLGLLTVREMMYFTNYHVLHHQINSIKNLYLNDSDKILNE